VPRKSGLIVVALPPKKDLISVMVKIAKELPQYAFLWIGHMNFKKINEEKLPSNFVHSSEVNEQDALGNSQRKLK
jgi:hypothetical protein